MKTAKIILTNIKDPDGWQELAEALGLSANARKKFFEFGEYASIEIVVDADCNIVGGRILKI